MGSPTVPSALMLGALKGQIQGHSNFEVLYLIKEPRQYSHVFLLNK